MLTRSRMAAIAAILLLCAGAAIGGHGLFIRVKAVAAQILLEHAWSESLDAKQPVKAWPWADTWPVARLSFPTLHRSAIVLEEAGGEAMAFGPAHVAASPLPGERGLSIIGGHRDTHFRFIRALEPGAAIEVTTQSGERMKFIITGTAIVHAQASGLLTEGDVPRLALVTCYPFDAVTRGPMRYVVFAEADGNT